jgi:hypothetical protein
VLRPLLGSTTPSNGLTVDGFETLKQDCRIGCTGLGVVRTGPEWSIHRHMCQNSWKKLQNTCSIVLTIALLLQTRRAPAAPL